ncbi:PASTA domain-containing protein [Naasia aerilata]|uniref:PASTA domain-containing protein n=1 Tax=Naasia aerilata TaxID=1162966 RepID=A0ABN6XPX7_9MICO|nr:PASTA domain-containing protein [Naasia aerilata]BDZ47069.1 hypothetical protein GCM10025866_29780 [Naasia aerilata]
MTSGYSVYTTLDMDLQTAAQWAINDNVPKAMDGVDIGSISVTVQPGTGRVLAMAQNKDYSDDPSVLETTPTATAVNYNTDEDYGGSNGFQPGSTFKMFTLLEWLKEGHGLNETVDARRRTSGWGTFKNSCQGGTVTAASDWNPRNDEGGNGGTWTALYNTVNSENTGFIAMAKQLDLCGIDQTAEALGVHRANLLRDDDGNLVLNAEGKPQYSPMVQDPSFVLGTNEIAPLSMAAAYAGVAAGGKYCTPIAIDKIVAPNGSEVPVPPVTCTQAIDPNVAAGATFALQQAFRGGTGAPSAARLDRNVPAFTKTGTTDDAWATWITGGTTKAVTAVGVFNVSGHVNLRELDLPAGEAATLRHKIWPRVMQVAVDKWGGDPFPSPSGQVVSGKRVPVPSVAGLSFADAKAKLEGAGFGVEDGGQQDSNAAVGTVIGTSPSGDATPGALISVYTSNGALFTVPDAVSGKNSFAEAKATLANFGFANVQENCQVDPAGTGKPEAQDPPAGSAGKADTVITITTKKPAC